MGEGVRAGPRGRQGGAYRDLLAGVGDRRASATTRLLVVPPPRSKVSDDAPRAATVPLTFNVLVYPSAMVNTEFGLRVRLPPMVMLLPELGWRGQGGVAGNADGEAAVPVVTSPPPGAKMSVPR